MSWPQPILFKIPDLAWTCEVGGGVQVGRIPARGHPTIISIHRPRGLMSIRPGNPKLCQRFPPYGRICAPVLERKF